MSYSNGLLPSSTSSSTMSPQRGLPGVGFKLTDDGDYDIDGKRLTNVADSIDDSDAVSLKVLKEHTQVSQIIIIYNPASYFIKSLVTRVN